MVEGGMIMSIGKRLLSLRQEKGLSQEELASYLHVSRQTISKWESDLSLPDMKMILTISEFYQVSVSDLLGLKEDSQNSIEHIYEQTNLVLENIQKESKKRKTFDIILICICILSLIFSIVLMMKISNREEATIINHYNEIEKTEEEIIEAPEVKINKIHLDNLTMEIDLKWKHNIVNKKDKVYLLIKDKNGKELKTPLKFQSNTMDYVYKGEIPLFSNECFIMIENEEQIKTYDCDGCLEFNYDDLIDNYINIYIPREKNDYFCFEVGDDSYFDFEYEVNDFSSRIDIPCVGQLKGTIDLKITKNNELTLFDQSFSIDHKRTFNFKHKLNHLDEIETTYSLKIGEYTIEHYGSVKYIAYGNYSMTPLIDN